MTELLLLALTRWFHWGACLLLVSSQLFVLWIVSSRDACAEYRPGDGGRGFHLSVARLNLAVWVIAFISNLFWAALTAFAMAGSAAGVDLSFIEAFLQQTNFGHVLLIRLALLLLLGLGLAIAGADPPGSSRRKSSWTNALLACLVLETLALTGHAAATPGPAGAWHLAVDAVHLGAAAVWPGELVCFALWLRTQQTAPGDAERFVVFRTTRRFSISSVAAVTVLGTTGLGNALFFVRDLRTIYFTPYGWFLAAKSIVFLVLLTFGAVNLFILSPKLRSEDQILATLPSLLRNVGWEILLAAVVLLLVALLGTTEPPH